MNHVYRLVWNRSLNALVAVAENAGSGGKASSPRQRKSGRPLITRLAPVARAVLLALGLAPAAALALPTGGQVVSGNASINHNGNTLTVTQTINKAHLTVTAANQSRLYGAANPTFTESLSGFVNGETSAVVTGTLTGTSTATATTGAGTAAITASAAGLSAANYDFPTLVNGTLTINKAPLTVTANAASMTYNGTTYSGGNGVSYSGFVNNETSSVLGGTLSYGGTSQGAKNAGNYVITPSGLTSSNYAFTYTNGTLTINKAPLTLTGITASNKTYDGTTAATLNTGSAGFTGLVAGDTVNLSGVGVGTFSDQNVGTNKAVTVSGYTLGGGSAGNYTLAQPAGLTANITPAALTVTANNASKTYDGQAWSGGNGVVYTGFVNGETSAVLGGTLTYGGNSQGATAAGSYLITPSGLSSGNYAITYASGTLTVIPKALTGNSGSSSANGAVGQMMQIGYTVPVGGPSLLLAPVKFTQLTQAPGKTAGVEINTQGGGVSPPARPCHSSVGFDPFAPPEGLCHG